MATRVNTAANTSAVKNKNTSPSPTLKKVNLDDPSPSQGVLIASCMTALKHAAIAPVGAATGATLVPIQYHGDFNWFWTAGNGDFNKPTYDYVSGAVTPSLSSPGTYGVGGSGSFGMLYSQLVNAIEWQFNQADQNRLQQTKTATSVQAASVVSTYTSIYGPVTPAQLTTAQKVSPAIQEPIDYVLSYQAGYLWAGVATGSPPLSWHSMQSAANLGDLLQFAPPSADPVIEAISSYLNVFGSTVTLMDEQSFGMSTLKNLLNNLTPSSTNGGILQSNPPSTAYFLGYGSQMQPSDILLDLQNASSQATVTFSASKASQSSYNISFSGGASIGWEGELLGISSGTTFQGDVADQQGSGSSFSITMVYPGVTVIPFAPTSFANNSGGATGWLDETVIYQALTNFNNGSTATGFTFPSGLPSGITLGENGVGYLSAVVVSGFPTITVNFSEGSFNDFSSWLSTHTSVSVNLFGFIPLGGGSVDTYTANASQNSQGSGFTLTLTPPQVQGSTTAANQGVPVLAGQISWLGATAS